MARTPKIYKRNTQRRKQKPAQTAPTHILQMRTSEERATANHFNYRVREAFREDLLDRL